MRDIARKNTALWGHRMPRHSAILALLALLLVPQGALTQGRPAGVQTETVSMREMTETVRVFGEVVAVRQSAVAARVSGLVSAVPAQVGTSVREGDPLAQMDTAQLEIELAGAEAQLAIATAGLSVVQAQLDQAQRVFQRAQDLSASASISSAQVEDRATELAEAQGSLAQSRARIAEAENAIALAEYNMRNATVRAPFDGVILDVAAQPGQFAAAGSLVATLLDIQNLEIEANVPARYIDVLADSGVISGETGQGEIFEMTLRAVLPTEFSETRTRPVRLRITTPETAFALGQPVTLDIPVGAAREVLTVPKDALVQARGGWTAFVNEDGKAAPRTVMVGAAIDDSFEVVAGLELGDEVVVRGNERLRPGQDIAAMGGGGPPQGDGPAEAGGPPQAAEGVADDPDAPADEG
jgi:RND family efflux transporter MFP subunit